MLTPRRRWLAVFVTLGLVVASCGDDDEDGAEEEEATVIEKSVKDNGKESAKSTKPQVATEEKPLRTLAIDIGATGLH